MRRASGPSSPEWSGRRGSCRRDARSVEHVRRVEEDLLDRLALLADEAHDAEAMAADLARSVAAPLEVAAAEAPPPPEVLVDLSVGADVERPLGGRARAEARGASEPGAAEPAEPDDRDGRDDRDREEKADHPRAAAT